MPKYDASGKYGPPGVWVPVDGQAKMDVEAQGKKTLGRPADDEARVPEKKTKNGKKKKKTKNNSKKMAHLSSDAYVQSIDSEIDDENVQGKIKRVKANKGRTSRNVVNKIGG